MSSNPKINLLITQMRKTKQRVTSAAKLQALARGKRTPSQQEQQNKAATKLQVLARGKRDRRAAIVKKQHKQVRGRSAYKIYLSKPSEEQSEFAGVPSFGDESNVSNVSIVASQVYYSNPATQGVCDTGPHFK